jgi:predicted deacetylase
MTPLQLRLLIYLGVILILLLIYLFFFYYGNILFGPSILFDEDENIKIGLYPNNHEAAFVFTVDDVNSKTNPLKIERVSRILDKHNMKSVFFVVPFYKGIYKMTKNLELTKTLQNMQKKGHEIGLHGLTHNLPHLRLFRLNRATEFSQLPYTEQKRRVLKGKKILEEAGFNIRGFRSPAFSANFDTLNILDNNDFIYSSDIRVTPFILMSNKRHAESLYYPFHIKDLNIIEFVNHGDYFWYGSVNITSKINIGQNLDRMIYRFNKYYNRNGVFVMMTHIEPINNYNSMKTFEKFVEYVSKKDVWCPNLRELTEWWLARESLYATSYVEGDVLKINLEKGNEYNMKNLTIILKSHHAKSYEIYLEEELIKMGLIKENVIRVNI